MWDRKRSDSIPQGSEGPSPAYQTAPSAASAATTRPTDSARATATIGKAVKIIGDVQSEEDLLLDGEIIGSLVARNARLTIGPNGKAKSDLVAREIVIHG